MKTTNHHGTTEHRHSNHRLGEVTERERRIDAGRAATLTAVAAYSEAYQGYQFMTHEMTRRSHAAAAGSAATVGARMVEPGPGAHAEASILNQMSETTNVPNAGPMLAPGDLPTNPVDLARIKLKEIYDAQTTAALRALYPTMPEVSGPHVNPTAEVPGLAVQAAQINPLYNMTRLEV